MSEINSIANGTYTIGQTSATNFQAGPGIKIDEPSAGTVRIGNDETVLWSGTYSTSTTQLVCSESIANFDKIDVWWIQQNARPIVNTYQTQNLGQIFVIHGKCENGHAVMFIAGWDKGSDNKTFTKNYCKYSPTDNWGTFVDANELVPVKIIGINRISGGNE